MEPQAQEAGVIEAECRARLAAAPDDLEALGVLGAALHQQRRFREAAEVFLRATALAPAEPMYWMNVGTARNSEGKHDDALQAFARAAGLGAAGLEFEYNLALVHMARGDFNSARALLAHCREWSPDDLEIRCRYAQACFERQRSDDALDALAGWESLNCTEPEVLADVGHVLMLLGDVAGAENALERAGRAEPVPVLVRMRRVQLLERTNRVADARSELDTLVADPDSQSLNPEFMHVRATVAQRAGEHDPACQLFRSLLSQHRPSPDRHFDLYPLAKSLEALGRHTEAYETLVAAHESQAEYLRRTAPLASLRGAPMMVIAERDCDPADVARWDHNAAPPAELSPVFVVAFPRSGTTLLELALDAHPGLRSMDEQPYLQNALDDLIAAGGRYPAGLSGVTPERLAEIRARYWRRAARKVHLAPGQRLVDKNPLNLLRLPVIQRLFPSAHILVAVRHPCDVILSCFQQHFRAPEFALMCQDLPRIAAGFRKSFEFWYRQQALLAPRSLEVRYEELVADFEGGLKSVIGFLGLPWNDAVAQPARRATAKRFISTPSYSQVVEPVSSRAVNRWHNYRDHFGPVIETVRPLLQRWGYEA